MRFDIPTRQTERCLNTTHSRLFIDHRFLLAEKELRRRRLAPVGHEGSTSPSYTAPRAEPPAAERVSVALYPSHAEGYNFLQFYGRIAPPTTREHGSRRVGFVSTGIDSNSRRPPRARS